MQTIVHVSFQSASRAELSVGIGRYLARLGQNVLIIGADTTSGLLEELLGCPSDHAAIMSRDGGGGVQITHKAISGNPKDWVEFARGHDIDTLWLDGSPGTWCRDCEPDEVLLSLRPSWTETLALSNQVDRKATLLAIDSPVLTLGADDWRSLVAPISELLGPEAPLVSLQPIGFEQRMDDLRSKQLRLAYDGTSIQRIVTHLVDSEALARALRPAIDAALSRLLDDPDGTYEELTRLAALHPHPDTLLAAMKFFRLQPRPDRLPLQTAIGYWHMTGDASHTVLGDLLRYALEHRPNDVPTDFVIAIAHDQPSLDDTLATTIASHLQVHEPTEAKTIVSVLDPLVLEGRATIETFEIYLPALAKVQGAQIANAAAERQANRYRTNPAFHIAWAQAILIDDDNDTVTALLANNSYNNMLVTQHAPDIARKLSQRLSSGTQEAVHALADYDGFLRAIREGHPTVVSPDAVAKSVVDLYRLNRLDAARQLAFADALDAASKRWAKRSFMQRLWHKLPIELDTLVPLRLRS